MRVGLHDSDATGFPNLALMKLSAYHKSIGDTVEWWYPLMKCDRVYSSKVFTFTPENPYLPPNTIKGGTGYGNMSELPPKVEDMFPDYSIYPDCHYAIGFLTRGCIRNCPWCIVPKKEGAIRPYQGWLDIKRDDSRDIVFMDNNVLACEHGLEQMRDMIGKNVRVDFNQGLDARLMTEAKADALGEIKVKEIHFAWDDYKQGDSVLRGLEIYNKYAKRKPNGHNCIVYTLVNFDTTLDQDLERIYTLRRLGFWAYVMIYDKPHAAPIYKKLQRWVNNRFVFAKCDDFNDYLKQTL